MASLVGGVGYSLSYLFLLLGRLGARPRRSPLLSELTSSKSGLSRLLVGRGMQTCANLVFVCCCVILLTRRGAYVYMGPDAVQLCCCIGDLCTERGALLWLNFVLLLCCCTGDLC